MSATPSAENGLHPCAGCGVELDADDRRDRCEDCESRAQNDAGDLG